MEDRVAGDRERKQRPRSAGKWVINRGRVGLWLGVPTPGDSY